MAHRDVSCATSQLQNVFPAAARSSTANASWMTLRILLLTLGVILCDSAVGQEPAASTDTVPAAALSLPQPETSELTAACDCGYWLLSTHASPQSFDHSCPRFCPGVNRFDDGAGFRRADFAELTASLEPGVPVCIFVHGSFVDWQSACRESQCTYEWLRRGNPGMRMQFIYLSWPSYRPITPLVQLDVAALGRRAARNGYYLADLLRYVPPECPVSLIGHSHGTRVIAAGMHLMAGGSLQGCRFPQLRNQRRIRTVFFASAIDHDWMNPGQRYDRALCSAECVLNIRNGQDSVLRIYPLRAPFSSRALGQSGLTSSDRQRLGGLGRKVYEADFSRSLGSSHWWPNYFRRPGLASYIRNYVYFSSSL